MALVKHGKYVLAGVGGMWYTGFMDAVGSVLNIERAWIRLVGSGVECAMPEEIGK